MEVERSDRYRCPVQGCGCEITVSTTPEMEATQNFMDCCGHEIKRVE